MSPCSPSAGNTCTLVTQSFSCSLHVLEWPWNPLGIDFGASKYILVSIEICKYRICEWWRSNVVSFSVIVACFPSGGVAFPVLPCGQKWLDSNSWSWAPFGSQHCRLLLTIVLFCSFCLWFMTLCSPSSPPYTVSFFLRSFISSFLGMVCTCRVRISLWSFFHSSLERLSY